MVKHEAGRLNAACFVPTNREVGCLVTIKAKFWLCVLIDRHEGQSGFGPLFTNDVCYVDELVAKEDHQSIAEFIHPDFSDKRSRHTQSSYTNCDIKRRTADPLLETNTSSETGSNVRRYKIKKSFAADQYRGDIVAHRDLHWGLGDNDFSMEIRSGYLIGRKISISFNSAVDDLHENWRRFDFRF